MNEHPAQHEPADLTVLTANLLAQAEGVSARRSSSTLISGAAQRVTLTALLSGAELGEHVAPRAASLQVLSGEIEVLAGDRRMPITAGGLVAVPRQRHSLRAITDAAILLTVAVD